MKKEWFQYLISALPQERILQNRKIMFVLCYTIYNMGRIAKRREYIYEKILEMDTAAFYSGNRSSDRCSSDKSIGKIYQSHVYSGRKG